VTKDLFQSIDSLDAAAFQRVVDRLEWRGAYEPFVRMRNEYLDRIQLAPDASIHELGCGSGVVCRAFAKRYQGRIVGSDFSRAFIDAAKRIAAAEGLGSRIEFKVTDAQNAGDADASYDAVVCHTLVSHVPSPDAVLGQAARLVKPGGTVVVFDGDYASLAFATGERALDAELSLAIQNAIAAQPLVMRELPGLAKAHGLRVADFMPHAIVEAGKADYFAGMAETFAPMAARQEIVAAGKVNRWLEGLRAASAAGSFYGTCVFATYLLKKGAS
jgi:2-polyprenyl-3-methyl-5-hydroxy-6-metoxy-1,4-benzoquinol methylase